MQRLDTIGAAQRGAVRGRRRAAAAARGRVRGRPPHRDRNRGRRQAGEHPERRGIAGADPSAPLPRVPERVAARVRRPAIDDVARRGARSAGARRRDAVGRGDRGVRHALRPRDRRRGPRLRRASARARRRARRHGIGGDARRAVGQHAPRHADHGRDVLWPRVRRFPEPAATRAGDRTQHGGVRSAHARPRSRAPSQAAAARTDQGVDVAFARRLDHRTSNARARRLRRRHGRARRGVASGFTWTRRSSACDRPRRAPCTRSLFARCLDCRATSMCGSNGARRSQPLLEANEAMVARVRDEVPGLTIDAASALLPSDAAQERSHGPRPRSGAAAAGGPGRPGSRGLGRGIPRGHARSLSSAASRPSRSRSAPHVRRIPRARPGRRHRPVRLT